MPPGHASDYVLVLLKQGADPHRLGKEAEFVGMPCDPEEDEQDSHTSESWTLARVGPLAGSANVVVEYASGGDGGPRMIGRAAPSSEGLPPRATVPAVVMVARYAFGNKRYYKLFHHICIRKWTLSHSIAALWLER